MIQHKLLCIVILILSVEGGLIWQQHTTDVQATIDHQHNYPYADIVSDALWDQCTDVGQVPGATSFNSSNYTCMVIYYAVTRGKTTWTGVDGITWTTRSKVSDDCSYYIDDKGKGHVYETSYKYCPPAPVAYIVRPIPTPLPLPDQNCTRLLNTDYFYCPPYVSLHGQDVAINSSFCYNPKMEGWSLCNNMNETFSIVPGVTP